MVRWYLPGAVAALVAVVVGVGVRAGERVEGFDREPAGWEAHNNRIVPAAGKAVGQDFGYLDGRAAGREAGEIGGVVWRGAKRASYADRIEPARTLTDRLEASGTFRVTATSGSSGVFFGWFKEGGVDGELGRQNSLGFRFAGEGSGARLSFQLVTATNQACGTKITPWIVDKTKTKEEGRKYRPTSIRHDGTRYTWRMTYDPEGNGGDGEMTFTVRGDREPHDEAFEGRVFKVALPKGYKSQGTSFDRFGMMNSDKPGNSMTVYFDDLAHDGKTVDLAHDPGWLGVGNREHYERTAEGGAHDFGYSAGTNFAGGERPGELGGVIWRSGAYAYYADRVGPLSLADRLEASGRVVLKSGPPDSGMYVGWFNGGDKERSPVEVGNFVGVKVGGPTRVGHYFSPGYATAQAGVVAGRKKEKVAVERGEGPLIVPGRAYEWRIVYDPSGAGGRGSVEATLGGESVTLALKEGDKARGAALDRFGLFTTHRGGSFVKIYFDDLRYTAGRE